MARQTLARNLQNALLSLLRADWTDGWQRQHWTSAAVVATAARRA